MDGPRVSLLATGDFNSNGVVDDEDAAAFDDCITNHSTNGACLAAFDFDGSGEVDIYDAGVMAGLLGTFVDQPTHACLSTATGSTIGNPYYFTGRRLDALVGANGVKQFYDYRTRIYDPVNARFSQRDLLGYVDGMNLYEYVSSRPTALVDPWGTQKYAAAECDLRTGQIKVIRYEPLEKVCKAAQRCILKHENKHKNQKAACCRRASMQYKRWMKNNNSYKMKKWLTTWNNWVGANFDAHECEAHKTSNDCFKAALAGRNDSKCCEQLEHLYKDGQDAEKRHCGNLRLKTKKGQPQRFRPYYKCPFDGNGDIIDWKKRKESPTIPLPPRYQPRPPSESQPGYGGAGSEDAGDGRRGGGPLGSV